MILINSRHSAPVNNNTPNPNNFGEAIASQFNDNIRDVSARLLETEKKLDQMHKENKSLQKQLKQPKQETSFALQDELNALKEKFASLTEHQTQSYPMEGNQAPVSGQIKDLDTLLDKDTERRQISLNMTHQLRKKHPLKRLFIPFQLAAISAKSRSYQL
uniref:hypothetical protein n=1 Tax=Legionella tunisiensis TaxID=1034944 RepID=UPI000309F82F